MAWRARLSRLFSLLM